MATLATPPQRHPSPNSVHGEKSDAVRKPALKPRKKTSPSRSRSPLERRVHFDPQEKEIPDQNNQRPGLMRMSEARAAVPRKEGESRSQWKLRVFQNKRKMEEEAVQATKKK